MDEVRLQIVERCIIRMICGVRLVNRVLTDILWDRVGVAVKIQDLIIQSPFWWSGRVIF